MHKIARATKGMNVANGGPTTPSPHKGVADGGIDLSKGYKVLGDVGRSPRAVPQNKL